MREKECGSRNLNAVSGWKFSCKLWKPSSFLSDVSSCEYCFDWLNSGLLGLQEGDYQVSFQMAIIDRITFTPLCGAQFTFRSATIPLLTYRLQISFSLFTITVSKLGSALPKSKCNLNLSFFIVFCLVLFCFICVFWSMIPSRL